MSGTPEMLSAPHAWSPGSLVRARGREWVVLPADRHDAICVRPLSGSESDVEWLFPSLELDPVVEARFPLPSADARGNQEGAGLLRDALLLSLRRGAGPFRSLGHLAVEPRAYQLVPLLMALKLDPVRLLIADDVGIGKTIEAGLIVRELLDRGEITRFTVLCPPHLVDQWVLELAEKFQLKAEPVTAGTASRLEKNLAMGETLFEAHRYTVVSLDYVKQDRRREAFLSACPRFVIVDEAHACAAGGTGRHQRYDVLRRLADDPERHMLLLSATPHSGDEKAFFRLLALLDKSFGELELATKEDPKKSLRERLARHFVQRRRGDITEWQEGRLFAKRVPGEVKYALRGKWEKFLERVLDYCAGVVAGAAFDARIARLNFWGTLTLMRCVTSSPAAAIQALKARAGQSDMPTPDDTDVLDRLFDASDDDEPELLGTGPELLKQLVVEAESLLGLSDDPKLHAVVEHVHALVNGGSHPVIFCRYLATAAYVRDALVKAFPDATVEAITGEMTADERRERVDAFADTEGTRILVATDCLSEGVNLQQFFNAVVHYDLSWNPTRHEQREGRVDRFGQESPVVHATLVYGRDNPVDGAVLKVILEKAAKIRSELGVPVPMPDDDHSLSEALLKAVLLRRERKEVTQGSFAFMKEAQEIDRVWEVAKERASRTVFAQRRLRPEDVLPEWDRAMQAVGSHHDVQRFTVRALAHLGAQADALPAPRTGGETTPRTPAFRAALHALPLTLRERLEAEQLRGFVRMSFEHPPVAGTRHIHRSHPLVTGLAESLLEATLGSDGGPDSARPGTLGRVGVWKAAGIDTVTTVALLRLRHQLTMVRGDTAKQTLVEESSVVAWTYDGAWIEGDSALNLLRSAAIGDETPAVQARFAKAALEQVAKHEALVAKHARARAEVLLQDHRRVRDASKGRGTPHVEALLPVDVIGLFVLTPKVA